MAFATDLGIQDEHDLVRVDPSLQSSSSTDRGGIAPSRADAVSRREQARQYTSETPHVSHVCANSRSAPCHLSEAGSTIGATV
jgi:hypothetical protein